MAIKLYVRGREWAFEYKQGRRIAWTTRKVTVLRYGKPAATQEHWLVVYDAGEGGNELARFKGDEVEAITYPPDAPANEKPSERTEMATSALTKLLGI